MWTRREDGPSRGHDLGKDMEAGTKSLASLRLPPPTRKSQHREWHRIVQNQPIALAPGLAEPQ